MQCTMIQRFSSEAGIINHYFHIRICTNEKDTWKSAGNHQNM